MRIPIGRLIFLSSTLTMVLLFAALCGGCPQEDVAVSRAQHTVVSARDDAAQLRAAAMVLPDGDPRKANALAAADHLDAAANDLLTGVANNKRAADADRSNTDLAQTIGNAIPVPWVGTAVAAAVAAYSGIKASNRGKALDAKTDEADTLDAQAKALIHSFEAAKSVPAFAQALPSAAPLIDAVQSTVPGTKALVDSTQKALAAAQP